MRLIDYLDTRADVDPQRIGIYGVSKGGIEAYLAAAVDPRIQVAVPCIAVESGGKKHRPSRHPRRPGRRRRVVRSMAQALSPASISPGPVQKSARRRSFCEPLASAAH
jgi:poly(3-hydroxybutyrate) depolymerase